MRMILTLLLLKHQKLYILITAKVLISNPMISSFAASEGGGIGGIIDDDYMQLTSTTTRQVMCNKISNWFWYWRTCFSDKFGWDRIFLWLALATVIAKFYHQYLFIGYGVKDSSIIDFRCSCRDKRTTSYLDVFYFGLFQDALWSFSR